MACFSCSKKIFSIEDFLNDKEKINIEITIFKYSKNQFYFRKNHINSSSLKDLFKDIEVLFIDEIKRLPIKNIDEEIKRIHRAIRRNSSILPLIPLFLFEVKNKEKNNEIKILNERLDILMSIKEERFDFLMSKIKFVFLDFNLN